MAYDPATHNPFLTDIVRAGNTTFVLQDNQRPDWKQQAMLQSRFNLNRRLASAVCVAVKPSASLYP
jgi:hypothetical protein